MRVSHSPNRSLDHLTYGKRNVRICATIGCENELSSNHGRARYCSFACSNKARRARRRHYYHNGTSNHSYPYTTEDGFIIYSKEDKEFDERVRAKF